MNAIILPFLLLLASGLQAATHQPRVLLIGDSIAGGYGAEVAKILAGSCVVVRGLGNAGTTAAALGPPKAKPSKSPATDAAGQVPDPAAYATMLEWYLAHGPFQVIHCNWGLHDLKHGGIPIDDYRANLSKILDLIQASPQNPGARIIFATTTPVPERNRQGRIPAKVVEFNQAAVALMAERRVAVNDLYAVVHPHQEAWQLKDDVHFGAEGCQGLAEAVAQAIRQELGLGGSVKPSSRSAQAQTAPTTSGAAPSTSAAPVNDAALQVAKLVRVVPEPAVEHAFDYLAVGTRQHLDRTYVYCWVPEDMAEGIVYQGPHRAALNQSFTIEVLAPTTIWFCVKGGKTWGGGWHEVFAELEGWQRVDPPLLYHNSATTGKNGKDMVRYRLDAEPGTIVIPPAPRVNAVMSIVFRAAE